MGWQGLNSDTPKIDRYGRTLERPMSRNEPKRPEKKKAKKIVYIIVLSFLC